MSDLEAARRAKVVLTELLGADERIAGVGIAPAPDGGYRVKVDLSGPEAAPAGLVPTDVDGVAVVTEIVGEIRSL